MMANENIKDRVRKLVKERKVAEVIKEKQERYLKFGVSMNINGLDSTYTNLVDDAGNSYSDLSSVSYYNQSDDTLYTFLDLIPNDDRGFLDDGFQFVSCGKIETIKGMKATEWLSLKDEQFDIVLHGGLLRNNVFTDNKGNILRVRINGKSLIFSYLKQVNKATGDYKRTVIKDGDWQSIYRSNRLVAAGFGSREFIELLGEDCRIYDIQWEAHHINGDKLEDTPENLILVPQSIHKVIHKVERDLEDSQGEYYNPYLVLGYSEGCIDLILKYAFILFNERGFEVSLNRLFR